MERSCTHEQGREGLLGREDSICKCLEKGKYRVWTVNRGIQCHWTTGGEREQLVCEERPRICEDLVCQVEGQRMCPAAGVSHGRDLCLGVIVPDEMGLACGTGLSWCCPQLIQVLCIFLKRCNPEDDTLDCTTLGSL